MNIEKQKKIDILRILIDIKYFVFHEQIYEQTKIVFLIKNISKKFNFITRKQLKTTNNIISQFTTSIRINDYKITIIINSNVLTNFISTNFVNKKIIIYIIEKRQLFVCDNKR